MHLLPTVFSSSLRLHFVSQCVAMAAESNASREATPGQLGRVATAGSIESVTAVTAVDRGQSQISGFSVWRWPLKPGELPLYVQRAFAVKMFGLLAFQLLLCLALMLPAHRPGTAE
eukprot:s170_g6.t1